MTDFGAWTLEYVTLVKTQRQLNRFIEERYEAQLREIARSWAHAREPELERPCEKCTVQVTTLIDEVPGIGWYFEWQCSEGWGCNANTCGWRVPLVHIAAELERRRLALGEET